MDKGQEVGLIRLKAGKLVYEGSSLCKNDDNKTVFARGALPGEIVRARVCASKKEYDEAEAVEIIEKSPDRVEPVCPVYGKCGGCCWQHLKYDAQIEAKTGIIIDQLSRIGKFHAAALPRIEVLRSEPYGYRRVVRFLIQNGRVGFRKNLSREIAETNSCPILIKELNDAAEQIAPIIEAEKIESGELRMIWAEKSASLLVYVWSRNPLKGSGALAAAIMRESDAASVLTQNAGTSNLYGEPSVEVEDGLSASPLSFLQSNAAVNRMMTDKARSFALSQAAPDGVYLDLYCGSGNFTRALAAAAEESCASRLIGVEGDAGAVRLAEKSKTSYGARLRIDFIRSSVGMRLLGILPKAEYRLILLDPPRDGAKEAIHLLGKLAPAKVVYVSCNPSTLARDLKTAASFGYQIKSLVLADQFPQSYHVESMTLLEKV